jgi:hypothetical protein
MTALFTLAHTQLSNGFVKCPTCLEPHMFKSITSLDKLIKNFTLLSLAETKKLEKMPESQLKPPD